MSRTVKRVLVIAFSLVGILFCAALYSFAVSSNTLKPLAGYIAPDESEPFFKPEILEAELLQDGITLLKREDGESPEDAAKRMVHSGVRVIIVGQNSTDPQTHLISLLEQEPVTLLFVGHRPDLSALGNEDKAWYLGSNDAHGGELLGGAITDAFKAGTIPDLNGDHILQVLVINESSLTQHALEECEHLGVYSEVIPAKDETGAPLPLTAEAYAGIARPEFILCDNGLDARPAHELAQAMGWLDGENPVRIGCSAASKDGAAGLLADGITDLPVPYYDVDAVSQSAAVFVQNILDFRFIGQGTPLVPNSADRFILPYQLMNP